jgi:hypothetical protein
MRKKAKWLLIIIMLVIAGTVAVDVWRSKPYVRLHSDMLSVNAALTEELQDYYENEGRYPDRLEILTGAIVRGSYIGEVPEKPKELGLLPRFDYSTDGEAYTLTWSVGRRSGTVFSYKEYGRDGALVRLEMYIDGELESRQIYGGDGALVKWERYVDGEIVSQQIPGEDGDS